MNPYIAIFTYRSKLLLSYRSSIIAGTLTNFFWGFIKIVILTAFYLQSKGPQPITLEQAITFIWLGQFLLCLLPWFRDKEIEQSIKNGNVAYELVKPLDIYWVWFTRSMVIHLIQTLIRASILFLLIIIFFHIQAPATICNGFAFIISCIIASFLSAAISTLESITLFWTISGEGIQRILPELVLLVSGMIIPLPLFPKWIQPIINIQPFRGLIDIPCRIYTGIISNNEIFYYLMFQIIWTLIFILLGRLLTNKALKKFVIFGG